MDKLREDIRSAYFLTSERYANRRSDDEIIELETRMGVTGYETGTKYLLWENAYKAAKAKAVRKTKTRYSQDVISDGHISYRRREGRWEAKVTSATYDNFDVYMRVQVSVETPSHGPPILQGPKDQFAQSEKVTRRIARHSFYMNKSARVDFSRVYTIKNGSPPALSFEIEVEYTHTIEQQVVDDVRARATGTVKVGDIPEEYTPLVIPKTTRQRQASSLAEYTDTVIDVYKMLFNSPLPFTYSNLRSASAEANAMLSAVVAYANKKSSTNPPPYVDRAFFSEARALDLNSLSASRLFGKNGSGVIISPKTNGDRIFLIVTKFGCFGVYPPSRAALYSESEYTKTSGLTVIDGELYNGVLYYIDALYLDGEDTREHTYNDRSARFEEWAADKGVEQLGIEIRTKLSMTLSRKTFFSDIEKMYERLNHLEFPTDGIMFTPDNQSYVDSTGNVPIIMKWKPDITLDFRVNNGTIYYTDDTTNTDVEFRGTLKSPFRGKIIKGDVVFAPGSIVEFTHENGDLVAFKTRPEKLGPNKGTTALDNWEKATIDYVSPDALMCKTNELMRKYHGRIKGWLFSRGKGVLLDIGSGRGGDIGKWANYSLVLCVEPDPKNRKEFLSRLSNRPLEMRQKVHLLDEDVRGQDSARIREFVTQHVGSSGKVDVVSMMDSLTFFFDDQRSLVELKRTVDLCLKPNGMFLWKALDGEVAKRALTPTGRLPFGVVDYLQADKDRLYVNIEPHVKGHEWYTDIDMLKRVLEMKGDVLRATAEDELLTDDYRLLSSMYSYSVFTSTSTVAVPQGVKDVLLKGVTLPEDFVFPDPVSSNTCIEAIEYVYTRQQHNRLLGEYIKVALQEDTSYVPAKAEPAYTKFETANNGYLVQKLYESMEKTESELIHSLDPRNIEVSLSFASLLGLDVYVSDPDGNFIASNRSKGSTKPVIRVEQQANGTYYVSDEVLGQADPTQDEYDPEFGASETILKSVQKDLYMETHVNFQTPALIRAAYTKGVDTGFRLTSIANHLAGMRNKTPPEDLLDIYAIEGITHEEAVRIITENIDIMMANY